MSTIKAYTDLEQSKKLVEILPIDTADCCYIKYCTSDNNEWRYDGQPPMILGEIPITEITAECIPCWSLAALLDVLPQQYYPIKNLILGKPKDKWCVLYWDATGMEDGEQTLGDNPVDACYEMILKLHELNLL